MTKIYPKYLLPACRLHEVYTGKWGGGEIHQPWSQMNMYCKHLKKNQNALPILKAPWHYWNNHSFTCFLCCNTGCMMFASDSSIAPNAVYTITVCSFTAFKWLQQQEDDYCSLKQRSLSFLEVSKSADVWILYKHWTYFLSCFPVQ